MCSAAYQVDSKAFDALLECIAEGDLDTCEQVPAGDEDGFLVNPLGGLAVDMSGPAGYVLNFVFSHIYHHYTVIVSFRNEGRNGQRFAAV